MPTPRPSGARRRLVLFVIVAALVVGLLLVAGSAVLPFGLGLVFAYLVAPLVSGGDRLLRRLLDMPIARWPWIANAVRPTAILGVYVLVAGVLAGGLVLLSVPLTSELGDLAENAPSLAAQAEALAADTVFEVQERLPDQVETEILAFFTRERVQALGLRAFEILRDGAMATVSGISSTVGFLVAGLIVPFWLFYILNDTGRFMQAMISLVPRDIRGDVEALRIIIDRVLSGYIRGQLLIAFMLGVLLTITLMIIGVPYALTLGVAAGAFGIIPFVGAILGAIPAIIVALLQSPSMALWTLIGFLIVQQIDSFLISPRVQGDSVSLNPGVIMVVIVVGQAVMGLVGLLLAVPLTAAVRDVVHYLYLRVGEDPVTPAEAMGVVGYGADVNAVVRGEKVAAVVAAG
jgi:predicted PurR-regulated permease PerM